MTNLVYQTLHLPSEATAHVLHTMCTRVKDAKRCLNMLDRKK